MKPRNEAPAQRRRGAVTSVGAARIALLAALEACALPHAALDGRSPDGAVRRDEGPREGGPRPDAAPPPADAAIEDTLEPPLDEGAAPEPDAAPPGLDAAPPGLDAALDEGPPPADALVFTDAALVPEVVSTDVVEPRVDGAIACGAAGQRCCEGASACGAGLGCVTWGTGNRFCTPCGGPGQACCPTGTACTGGATCRTLYDGRYRACVLDAGGSNPGAECRFIGSNCGRDGLVCMGERTFSGDAFCVSCGGRGQPCCLSLRSCEMGASCASNSNGSFICR